MTFYIQSVMVRHTISLSIQNRPYTTTVVELDSKYQITNNKRAHCNVKLGTTNGISRLK